jgi:hypothetical protein
LRRSIAHGDDIDAAQPVAAMTQRSFANAAQRATSAALVTLFTLPAAPLELH